MVIIIKPELKMKKAKGFGKEKKTNSISIKLIPKENVTDVKLIEMMEIEELKWFAEVKKGEMRQQCALIPFNNSQTQKTRMSVRLLFCRPFKIILSQAEIDQLAKKATAKIYQI